MDEKGIFEKNTCMCWPCDYRRKYELEHENYEKLIAEQNDMKLRCQSILERAEEKFSENDKKYYEEVINKLKVDVAVRIKQKEIDELKIASKKQEEEMFRLQMIHNSLQKEMTEYKTLDATNEDLNKAREEYGTMVFRLQEIMKTIKKMKLVYDQLKQKNEEMVITMTQQMSTRANVAAVPEKKLFVEI